MYSLALASCKNLDLDIYQKARLEVKDFLNKESTQKYSRLLYFKRYLELTGQFSSENLFRLFHEYEGWLKHHLKEWVERNQERWELLTEFRERGLKLYIATNESLYTQMTKLSALDPQSKIFDGILTSEEAGYEKPDKKFYEALIKKFNLVPEKTYFIGDNLENDVFVPQSFNFKAIFLKEFSHEYSPLPHDSIEVLMDLRGRL